jgi:hypothetical protein
MKTVRDIAGRHSAGIDVRFFMVKCKGDRKQRKGQMKDGYIHELV